MNDPDFDAPVYTNDELVTVATYDDAVSARMALNHLCEAGLAAVLSDESTVAMDWLLSNAIGGIKVQVHSKDAVMAHRLLEEHHRGDGEAEEVARADDEIEDDDEADIEEEPPLSDRERNGVRAFRGALLGILFPPIEFYVLYLMYKVFVSDERLGPRYRNMAWAAGGAHADCPGRYVRDLPTAVGAGGSGRHCRGGPGGRPGARQAATRPDRRSLDPDAWPGPKYQNRNLHCASRPRSGRRRRRPDHARRVVASPGLRLRLGNSAELADSIHRSRSCNPSGWLHAGRASSAWRSHPEKACRRVCR